MRPRFLVMVSAAVLCCVGFEAGLGVYDRRQEERRNASPEPFYTWSLWATDGQRRLSGTGPLKLVLDPWLLYRNLPDQSGPWFRINSRGYRGPEPDLRREVRRIVLIGGSTAFGSGARSDRETFAQALERRCAPAQVINAGVIGYLSTDELTLLERELMELEPSLIIAFNGANDGGGTVLGEQILSGAFRQMEGELKERHELRTSVVAALGALGESIFPRLWERAGWLGQLPERMRRRWTGQMPDDGLQDTRVRLYTQNLGRMAALAQRKGTRLLVLLQPSRPPDQRMRYYDERYTRFLNAVAGRLRDSGIDFLNLHEWGEIRNEHVTDNIHLNAGGAELVAEHVFRHIQARGML